MPETTEKIYVASSDEQKRIVQVRKIMLYLFLAVFLYATGSQAILMGGIWFFSLIPWIIFLGMVCFFSFILRKIFFARWYARTIAVNDAAISISVGKAIKSIAWSDIKSVLIHKDLQEIIQKIYIVGLKEVILIYQIDKIDEIASTIKSKLPSLIIKEQKSFLYDPKNIWKIVLVVFLLNVLVCRLTYSIDENFGRQVGDWIIALVSIYCGWAFIFSKTAKAMVMGKGGQVAWIIFGLYFIYSGFSMILYPTPIKARKHFVCPLTRPNKSLDYFKKVVMPQSQVKIDSVQIKALGYVDGGTHKQFCRLPQRELSKIKSTDTVPASLGTSFGFFYTLNGSNKDTFYVPVLTQYLHPPITNPLTREVITTEEFPVFAFWNKDEVVSWNFEFERELMPGPWTMRVIYKDRVLAEKTFNVVRVSNIYETAQGRAKEIPKFKERIAQEPQNAELIKNLGLLYLDIGDYDQAIVEFKKAIAINPQPNYYNDMCLAYNDKKIFDSALEACNKALSINPEHTSAFINRGNTFRLQGQYKKAVNDFSHALVITPPNDQYNPPFAYYNRALAYEKMGEYDKAYDDAKQTIQISPNFYGTQDLKRSLMRKISLGRRLTILKENPVFLIMMVLLSLLSLAHIFMPQKIIEYQKQYNPGKFASLSSIDLEKMIRKNKIMAWALVIFILFMVLFDLGYIYFF